jgi:hypothetical protein
VTCATTVPLGAPPGPNYWGHKALRSCVRQAWNAGTPRSGTCVRGANGLDANGEPYMTLQ